MYPALRIIAVIFKLMSLVSLAGGVVYAGFTYSAALGALRGLRVAEAEQIAVLVTVLSVFVSLLIALFIYAAGEVIDVLLSIERSVYGLREAAAGTTPLHVVAARPRRAGPELPESREPSNAWRSPY